MAGWTVLPLRPKVKSYSVTLHMPAISMLSKRDNMVNVPQIELVTTTPGTGKSIIAFERIRMGFQGG